MGHYRARDLLLVPSLVSFLRIPLAGAFVWVWQDPKLALLVVFLAGLTDIVDGTWARHYNQATATGAVVDGITDKLFASVVMLTLVLGGRLDWLGAMALAAREILELPLVLWWALHSHRRRARADDPKANWTGKLATVLQFLTIAALLFDHDAQSVLLVATALMGIAAAAYYWRRELAVKENGR